MRAGIPLIRSLAARQAIITLTVAMIGGLLVSAIELTIDWRDWRARIEGNARQSIELVRGTAAEAAYQLNQEQAGNVVNGLQHSQPITHVTLHDNFGNLLASSGTKPNSGNWLGHQLLEGIDQLQIKLTHPAAKGSGGAGEVGALTIYLDGDPVAAQFVDLAGFKLMLRLAWALVLSALLSVGFHIFIIRPLESATREVTQIDPHRPAQALLTLPRRHTHDEFGQLVSTLNSLLQDFQHGLNDRDKAQTELAALARQLEARVAERTSELRATLEELELKKDAAEQAARSKSEFLSTVSHELRTPMNAVLGFIEILGMTELDEEQRGYVSTVQSSGNLLLGIINDILDFSRMENGKLSISMDMLDLAVAIDEVVLQQSARAESKQLLLETSRSVDAALVIGDPLRVRQVLSNLIGNAIKFTDSGSVKVALEAAANDMWRVTVTDSGIGIAPEDHGKLFASFSQVDGSATRRHGGTGLGLAISKKLVEAMGGNIGMSSTPGEGSSFWFELAAHH